MAHIVEGQTEGAETGVAKQALDIKQWLDSNRLGQLRGYFDKNEIVMEDLMDFAESDLDSVWTDPTVVELKLSPLYRTKFMKAWRKLTAGAVPSGGSAVQKIQRIVVSTKEQEAMSTMESFLSNIDEILKQNAVRQAKVTENTQRVSDEIDETFNGYISQMSAKAQELKAALNEESKQQNEMLLQQMQSLKKFRESVKSGLDSQSAMLIDTNLDQKKREVKIDEITSQTLGVVDEDTMKMHIPEIVFGRNDQSVSEFIASIGIVSGRPDPPVLDSSETTGSDPKIRFHSKYEKSAVTYCLRYRKDLENDDDEKESEWTEVSLTKDTDEYQLNGLSKATKYQLCGRYKLLEKMMWSRLSEPFCVTTRNADSLRFEWDPLLKRDGLTLHNNSKDVEHSDETYMRAVVSKNTLWAEHMDSALWEVTLQQMDSDQPRRILQIGFVCGNAADMVRLGGNNLGQSSRPKECALYIQSDRVRVRQNSKYTNFDAKWKGSDFKNGDRILFLLDFVQGKCTVSFNDTIAGVLSEDLPHQIRLVANISGKMKLLTSRFETMKSNLALLSEV